MDENIFVGATVLLVVCAIAGFFGTILFLVWKARRDPLQSRYPFDDPNFIHIGLTPRQLDALKPIALELRFMEWIPRHVNPAVDATYYAMSREEFVSFFGTVTKYARTLIADAANKQEAFLRGDAFTLYHLIVDMTPVRQQVEPKTLAAEFQIPLQPPFDSNPAQA